MFSSPQRHRYRSGGLWRPACQVQGKAQDEPRTLRITLGENDGAVTLKLEGRIVGPWAAELHRFWEETSAAMKVKHFFLDLRDTTYADTDGIRTLRAIYAQTGARILAGTLWTQYLAEEVMRHEKEPRAGEAQDSNDARKSEASSRLSEGRIL